MIKSKWLLNVVQVQSHTFVYEGDIIMVIPDCPFKRTKFFNLTNHARKLAEIERAVSIIIVDGGRRNLDAKERDAFEQVCKDQSISCMPIIKLNMKGMACFLFEGPQGTPGVEHMNGSDSTYCPGTLTFM